MSARINDETLHSLINLIYEAACDPARWPEFLRGFACAVKGRGTLIYTHNFETKDACTASDGGFPNAVVDFDPAHMITLESHYNHVNVWAENEVQLKPGRPVTGSMLYPERKLPSTEFFADWLRPQDYFHALGGVVLQDGRYAMKFSCLRGRREGDFSAEEIGLYQRLLPHLSRAARIQHRFAFLQGLSNSSLAVLDTVPAAVILLDASARALHMNTAGISELQRADPFRLRPSGELMVRGPSRTQTDVRTIIGAALDCTRRVNGRVPIVAQIARRSGEMLSVQALPLPRGSQGGRPTVIRQRAAACAVVVHGVAACIPSVGLHLLQHVYGLTPAEVKVARAIAEGETISGFAERQGVSRNTVASQLKRAFDKTGLKRQSELVRWLLLSGAALLPGALQN